MKTTLKVINFVSLLVVVITAGEPTRGSFSIIQLSLMFGSLALFLSTLIFVRIDKNEKKSMMQTRQRSAQTEMVAAELTAMIASGNKLASKLK